MNINNKKVSCWTKNEENVKYMSHCMEYLEKLVNKYTLKKASKIGTKIYTYLRENNKGILIPEIPFYDKYFD